MGAALCLLSRPRFGACCRVLVRMIGCKKTLVKQKLNDKLGFKWREQMGVPIKTILAFFVLFLLRKLFTQRAAIYDISKFIGERRDFWLVDKAMDRFHGKDGFFVESLADLKAGNQVYPLKALRYTGPGDRRVKLILSGAVHGDEPAGTAALFEFAEQLRKCPAPGLEVLIFPVTSPPAYVQDHRFTELVNRGASHQKRADLNRDFFINQDGYPELKKARQEDRLDEEGRIIHSSQEAPVLMEFLKKEQDKRPFDLHIDLHECSICQAGMIFTNDETQGEMLDAMYPAIKPNPGEHPLPIHWFDGLIPSLKTYKKQLYFIDPIQGKPVFARWSFVELNAPSFTLESPMNRSLEERSTMQLDLVNRAIQQLLNVGSCTKP